jgi:hypothetical protein
MLACGSSSKKRGKIRNFDVSNLKFSTFENLRKSSRGEGRVKVFEASPSPSPRSQILPSILASPPEKIILKAFTLGLILETPPSTLDPSFFNSAA